MPIGNPVQRAGAAALGQGATSVFSTTFAAGSVAVICACAIQAGKFAASAIDAGGNTWVVDAHASPDGTRTYSFLSAQAATGLTAQNVTITWNDATGAPVQYWLFEVTGLATSSVFDTSGTNTGTGTAVTASTGALAQASEVAFAMFRTTFGATTWAKGAAWSDPTNPIWSTTTSCEWQVVASAAALTADGTFGNSAAWSGMLATYKAPAAAPSTDVLLPHLAGRGVF